MDRRIRVVLFAVAIAFAHGCAKENASPFQRRAIDLNPFGSAASNADRQLPEVSPPPSVDSTAPERFVVRFKTTKGDFLAEINRSWSPKGADRFYTMVNAGYFRDIAIFRAVENFMFQFGLHGDPNVNRDWAEARFQDDPPAGVSNLPGTLCFAKTGAPNSRSVQMFVNLGQNVPLDGQGFTPFGKVIKGMDVVRAINTEYGENPGNEDVQGRLKREGNDYVLKRFPRIDIIRSVELIQPKG